MASNIGPSDLGQIRAMLSAVERAWAQELEKLKAENESLRKQLAATGEEGVDALVWLRADASIIFGSDALTAAEDMNPASVMRGMREQIRRMLKTERSRARREALASMRDICREVADNSDHRERKMGALSCAGRIADAIALAEGVGK